MDIDAFIARPGPLLRENLSQWVAPELIEEAVRVFRNSFLAEGVSRIVPMPGAKRLELEIRRRGGRLVVITSRIPRIARACLHSAGLAADAVAGDLSGPAKGAAMKDHQVEVYIGDHPLDMAGAQAAGIPGIGVETGGYSQGHLLSAGAAWVVQGLDDVVAALSPS
ncbi:MAG: HAD family hydrolase [Streptosporangiaceae bacterium]